MAKQGCNAHVGEAVSLQPRFQLLLGDVRGDEGVGASAGISRAIHVVVEHPRWLQGGNHNAQPSWQCVNLGMEIVYELCVTQVTGVSLYDPMFSVIGSVFFFSGTD